MSVSRRLVITIACAIPVLLILPETAYGSVTPSGSGVSAGVGYIDPGAGSIIIQIIVGAIAGGLALAAMYWKRAKAFLANLVAKRRSNDDKP